MDLGVVFAVDDTVYLDGGAAAAQMPEVAQTLYYTSAGLLVRTNKTGASDGGAPFHFQLVGADGTAQPLDLTLGEVVPSTDPDAALPGVLRGRRRRGPGRRRRRDDRGAGGPGGRDGPDRLGRLGRTAGRARRRHRLRLRLQARPRRGLAHRRGRAGRARQPWRPRRDGGRAVVTIATSDTQRPRWSTSLGRRAVRERLRVAPALARRPLRGRGRGRERRPGAGPRHGRRLPPSWGVRRPTYGWTADDQLVGVIRTASLAVCPPESGRCATSPLPDGVSADAFVRLPGFTYES